MGRELAVRGAQARDLAESGRVVASTLERTDEWGAFREAVKALGQTGKADLRAARSRLTELLAPEVVDAHESDLALPRGEYRARVTFDVVDSLEGSARSYTDAFAIANGLIETTASEVFGQLALLGQPISLPAAKLDLQGDAHEGRLEATEGYVFAVECGNVAWLDDPLVSHAVRIESISMSMDPAGGAGLKVGASILDNTGDAWNDDART